MLDSLELRHQGPKFEPTSEPFVVSKTSACVYLGRFEKTCTFSIPVKYTTAYTTSPTYVSLIALTLFGTVDSTKYLGVPSYDISCSCTGTSAFEYPSRPFANFFSLYKK